MTLVTLCKNATLEEAANAVIADLENAEKEYDALLANQKNQQLVQSSEFPDENNIPSSDTSINLGQGG